MNTLSNAVIFDRSRNNTTYGRQKIRNSEKLSFSWGTQNSIFILNSSE